MTGSGVSRQRSLYVYGLAMPLEEQSSLDGANAPLL